MTTRNSFLRTLVIAAVVLLSKASGKSYMSGLEVLGTWSYEIRGYYKVPGTSNTWTGKVFKGNLSC